MVERVEIVSEPTPADAPAPVPSSDRPAWLPEKFATPEDMAKAYGELEGKLGGSGNETPPDGNTPAPSDAPETPNIPDAPEADLSKLDTSKYDAELAENGRLADESYAELEQKGITRQMVDVYIAGRDALGEAALSRIHSEAGGTEKYAEMVQWAASNMSEAEKAAYNAAVNSSDEATVSLAVQGLTAKYAKAEGSSPNLVTGSGTTGGATGDVFRSNAEVIAAMSDKRYKTDPAYQKMVYEKIGRSNVLNGQTTPS